MECLSWPLILFESQAKVTGCVMDPPLTTREMARLRTPIETRC